MIYIAYDHISSEGPNGKSVLDADSDLDTLRNRVNDYMASPKMMNFNRGNKYEIPAGEMQSKTYYGSGGGCGYSAWITIEEVKPLMVEK